MSDHETVAIFIVQFPFILTILNLQFQPRVPVAIQFLPNSFHDFILPRDSCFPFLNILDDSIVIYTFYKVKEVKLTKHKGLLRGKLTVLQTLINLLNRIKLLTIQLHESLFENLSISFNLFLCFPFHLRGNTLYVVPAIFLTSPNEGIEVSSAPCCETLKIYQLSFIIQSHQNNCKPP